MFKAGVFIAVCANQVASATQLQSHSRMRSILRHQQRAKERNMEKMYLYMQDPVLAESEAMDNWVPQLEKFENMVNHVEAPQPIAPQEKNLVPKFRDFDLN